MRWNLYSGSALCFDQEIASPSQLEDEFWGETIFFGVEPGWSCGKKKRANRDARSSRDDPVAEHQYPFAVIEIESLRAASERASYFLEEICMRCQIFDLASGSGADQTRKRRTRLEISPKHRRPSTQIHHIRTWGGNFARAGSNILQPLHLLPEEGEKERASLSFLIWSSFKPLLRSHAKTTQERERVKFSLAPRTFLRPPNSWPAWLSEFNLCSAPKAKSSRLSTVCAHAHQPVEFGPDHLRWIGAQNPSSSQHWKWNFARVQVKTRCRFFFGTGFQFARVLPRNQRSPRDRCAKPVAYLAPVQALCSLPSKSAYSAGKTNQLLLFFTSPEIIFLQNMNFNQLNSNSDENCICFTKN